MLRTISSFARRVGVAMVLASVGATALVVVPEIAPLGHRPEPAAAAGEADYRSAVLADNPYGYLPLDETDVNSLALDVSGNGNSGYYEGNMEVGLPGPFADPSSRAAYFNGGWVRGDHALVPTRGDWTVEAWVMPIGDGFGDGDPIWSQYFDSYNRRTIAQLSCGPAWPRCISFQNGEVGGGSSAVLDEGHWYYAVWRRVGDTVTMLVNGVALGSVAAGDIDQHPMWIGGYQAPNWSGEFHGQIAHFAVYQRALSDARLRAHYSLAGPTGGPIKYWEQLGGCGCGHPSHAHTARPVDTATGNFWHSFDDLSVPGRGPALSLSRTYNSLAADVDSPFGYGWGNTYGMQLVDLGTDALITQENGSRVEFALSGGAYAAPPRMLAGLVHNADGTWTFTRRKREIFSFDAAGRLASIRDLNGYETKLTYPSSTSMVATDPAGRALTFTLSGGRITSVVDPASRTLSYTYDASGNLTDVIDVGGGHTTFTYDASHRMLTMRDPKYFGDTTTTPTPVTTNRYDADGRVDWQADPLGQATTFDYTTIPGSTIVTDPKGNVVRYDYSWGLLLAKTEGYNTLSVRVT